MLPALATTSDAAAFGLLSVTDAALLRASTRVRARARQQISAGTSTVTLRGPLVRLPQRPVTGITSVVSEDGTTLAATEYALSGAGVLELPSTCTYAVVYSHGFGADEYPDELIEVVCTIAARLGSTDATVAAGVSQEQSGSVSQTFGMDAWQGLGGLTREEKAVIDRLFPQLPGLVVMEA